MSRVTAPADSILGEAPFWSTGDVFSLCPRMMEGEGANPLPGGSALLT